MFINNNYNKGNSEKESKNKKNNYKTIEVTEKLIKRSIISSALDGRAPIEGIQRMLETNFGVHVSIGEISNVIKEASKQAAIFDDQIDLSKIKIGANDEIFQGDRPVLTGIDLKSTYIYLLEEASNRTADTWEIYMEDRKEKGLNLEETINDGAMALMLGVSNVFKGIEIQLDVFHATLSIGRQITIIGRKAYALIDKEEKLERQVKKKGSRKKTEEKLKKIRTEVEEAIKNYDILNILLKWLRELLKFTGYTEEVTKELIEYIVDEIEKNANNNSNLKKHIKGFRENSEFVLTYIKMLKKGMEKESKEKNIEIEAYEMMYKQLAYDWKSEEYQEIEYKLVKLLMEEYDRARASFNELLNGTKKASSLVENLNSRIRTYMNIKRIVPTNFFVLMKVYFNTKRFRRSRIEERVGKSPLELLTGEKQPNFLEAIGF